MKVQSRAQNSSVSECCSEKAREKNCIAFEPQEGDRDGQKRFSWDARLCLCLLLASLQHSSLKPLHSSSLTFLAGSSQAHLISYCPGKQKGKHQRARNALNQFILSLSLFQQLLSRYPQTGLINPTPTPKLEQVFCISVTVWVSDVLKEASTTCTPSRNWILERRKALE